MGFFLRLGIRAMMDEQNEADRISHQTRLRQRRLSQKRRQDKLRKAQDAGSGGAAPGAGG